MLNLTYVNMDNNGEASDVYDLFGYTSMFFYPKHDIQVINNGKTLFSALTSLKMPRTMGVFYTETQSDNISWSDPTPISYLSNETVRGYPVVVYCAETGRLWVFYYKISAAGLSICYATRPPNSTVFSAEHVILSNIRPSSFVNVNYTMGKNGKTVLHMFFTMVNETDGSSDLIYMKSEDNGVRWSFAEIADVIVEQQFEPIYLQLIPQENTIVVSNIDSNSSATNLRLTVSRDMGKTWKTFEYPILDEDQGPEKMGALTYGKWNNQNGIFAYIAYYEILRSGEDQQKRTAPRTKGTLKFIPLNDMAKDQELIPPFGPINPEIVVFPRLFYAGRELIAEGSVCKSYPFTWCELSVTRCGTY
jgi:hypothetical protein